MNTIWLLYFVLIGAVTGSFLNVVIYRLPRGQSIVFPGSHCPACGRAIRWYDNIPLVSWFVLAGRCRRCGSPISHRYIVIEAATTIRMAGLFACYYVLGLRSGVGPFMESWPMFLAHAILLCGLLACAVIDTENFFIPVEITWVCSVIGVASAAFRPHAFMPQVSPTTAAAGLAALAGLAIAARRQTALPRASQAGGYRARAARWGRPSRCSLARSRPPCSDTCRTATSRPWTPTPSR